MANPTHTKNYIPFFHGILTTPAGALPRGAQWIVAFHDLQKNILPGIKTALEFESKAWAIEAASQSITNDAFQKSSGCIFCQAIGLPGESLTTNPVGNIVSNSFVRSYVADGRNQWPEMRMSFLDTNISFADSFLRAWVVSTGMHGMIARDRGGMDSYRTDLTCYKLGSKSVDMPPTILTKYQFYDICCVSVSEEENSYEPSTSYVKREAKFIFNHYSIDTVSDNDFLGDSTKVRTTPGFPF
jgi:hypothetical protein